MASVSWRNSLFLFLQTVADCSAALGAGLIGLRVNQSSGVRLVAPFFCVGPLPFLDGPAVLCLKYGTRIEEVKFGEESGARSQESGVRIMACGGWAGGWQIRVFANVFLFFLGRR